MCTSEGMKIKRLDGNEEFNAERDEIMSTSYVDDLRTLRLRNQTPNDIPVRSERQKSQEKQCQCCPHNARYRTKKTKKSDVSFPDGHPSWSHHT